MLLAFAASFVSSGYSQSECNRSFIREQIDRYGECKNVAITESNGDVMLYGINGWAATSCCPSGLQDDLRSLHDNRETINDIVLTENGNYLILYGSNGFKGRGTPDNLWSKITNDFRNETVFSVTFNDNGDWIIITNNHYSASSSRIMDWLKDGANSYGQLWAACVTNDAMVAVFKGGYIYSGNVPESLKEALRKTNLDVYRLKIAGNSWFFADKSGKSYQYSM